MVVIENEDNLILFSFAYIPYDIKDIKLVSKPLIPNKCFIHCPEEDKAETIIY